MSGMERLTARVGCGRWVLNGMDWGELQEGRVITPEMREYLYGALCKLKDYEDTGLSPAQVSNLYDSFQELIEEVDRVKEETA